MKLSQINYDLSKPTEVEIKDPKTNQSFENPAFISLYSIESKQGKTAQLAIFRAIMNLREENKNSEPTEDEIKQVTFKPLATLISGWRGIEDEEGNELEFTPEKAEELISTYDIIYNAVNINTSLMGNFQKK